MEQVRAKLESLKLAEYADKFEENGFDQLEDLEQSTKEQLEELATMVGMKAGHKNRLIRGLLESASPYHNAAAVPVAAPAPSAGPGVQQCSKVASIAAIARMLNGIYEPAKTRLPLSGFDKTLVKSFQDAGASLLTVVTMLEVFMMSCVDLVKERRAEGLIPNSVTDDMAAALTLYTAGWTPAEDSFYSILNARLRAEDRSAVVPFYSMMRLMAEVFKRLSPFIGPLYRGVKADLSDIYKAGITITWWAFSSCTVSAEVLEEDMFLGPTGDRTIFVIENGIGWDISCFSFFQQEKEVLLPAGITLKVTSCANLGHGLHMVTLRVVDSQYCLVDLSTHLSTAGAVQETHISTLKEYTHRRATNNGEGPHGDQTLLRSHETFETDQKYMTGCSLCNGERVFGISENDTWVYIETQEGQRGYVQKKHLQIVNTLG